MNQFRVFKIAVVLVACFSAILMASMYGDALTSPQMNLSSDNASTNTPDASNAVPRDMASPRGQLLYENHCTICHDSGAHIRERSKARSLTDIRQQVYRWSQQLDLEWSRAEINDVANFLNQHFYHFSSGGTNSD